jgi:hypothetical protein
MSVEMVDFIDTGSGQTGRMPKRLFGQKPFTPDDRVLVEPGTKSYVPETYKPSDPETFENNHPEKVVKRGRKGNENEEVAPEPETQPEEDTE